MKNQLMLLIENICSDYPVAFPAFAVVVVVEVVVEVVIVVVVVFVVVGAAVVVATVVVVIDAAAVDEELFETEVDVVFAEVVVVTEAG